MEVDGRGSLISMDGVAASRMVVVSASVIFPCTKKVQKKISPDLYWHRLTQVVAETKGP